MARHEGSSSHRRTTTSRGRGRRSVPWLTVIAMAAAVLVAPSASHAAAEPPHQVPGVDFDSVVAGTSWQKTVRVVAADGWQVRAADVKATGVGFAVVGTPDCTGPDSLSRHQQCDVTVEFDAPTTAGTSDGILEAGFVDQANNRVTTVTSALTGTSVLEAPCTTCTVTSSVFYQPHFFNRKIEPEASSTDLFGEPMHAGIKLQVWRQSLGSGPFSVRPQSSIHVPKAFEDADRYLDLGGPVETNQPSNYVLVQPWGQSDVPRDRPEAGSYRNLWQVAIKPLHTLYPGDTITISAPKPFTSHPVEQTGYLGSGTRFPESSMTIPDAVTEESGDLVVRPYAIVPNFRGCGFINPEADDAGGRLGDCRYKGPEYDFISGTETPDKPHGKFTGASATNVAVHDGGRRVTITVPLLDTDPVAAANGQPSALEAGKPFTVMIAGVVAPPAGTYLDGSAFTVSTSKDTTPTPNGHGVNSLFDFPGDAVALDDPTNFFLGFGSLTDVDPRKSLLTVSATSASVGSEVVDGVDASLRLVDELHNPIVGKRAAIVDAASLTSDAESNVQITPQEPTTDGEFPVSDQNGEVRAKARDTTVEDVRLAAVVSPNIGDAAVVVPCRPGPVAETTNSCRLPTVRFVAGNPAPPPMSTITVDHTDRPADGLTAAKVTVTLKDKYGNPDLGHRVSLTPAGESMQATVKPDPGSYCLPDNPAKGACTGTTGDSAGTAVFQVTANRPGTVRLGVTDLDTLTIFPTETDAQVARIVFHGISTASSTVTAADSQTPIGSCTDVTVVVVDGETPGVGMQGRLVELMSDSETATISAGDLCPPETASARNATSAGPVEADNGKVTFKVSDTVPEDVTFTANVVTDGVTLAQQARVRFNLASSLVASPSVAVADGTQPTTLTVTLRSTDGSLVPGQCVGVAADVTHAGNTITPVSPVDVTCPATEPVKTDANGQAGFKATRTSPGDVGYHATAPGAYDVSHARATVRFLALPTGSSTLTSDATELQADGVAAAHVVFTARDAAGGAIKGLRVRLDQGADDHATIRAVGGVSGATDAVTDESGVARFRVTNHNIEDVSLTAQYLATAWTDVPEVALDISFIQPINEAYNSRLEALQESAQAGGSTLTVEVTLLDRDFNPLPRHAVALRSDASSVSFRPITEFGITDPDGVAQFAVSSTRPHNDVVIHAIDLETGVILDESVTVDFTQPPPTDAAASTIVAAPDVLPAGGATSEVTVTVLDEAGDPQDGHRISLRTGSTHTIVTGGDPTDQFGTTTFLVSGTVAETVRLTALDLTDSVTLADHPTITFTTAPTQANQSTVQVSPASVPAGGPKSTVTVTLKNASGAALSGHTIGLETGSATTTVQALTAGGVTDSAGIVKFTVADSAVESVVIRATDLTNGILLEDKPTITFHATEANQSTVVASPTNQVIRSDSTITVRLLDADGAPLAGHTVGLAMSSTIAHLDAATKVTGPTGVATFTLTGDTPGEVILTATDQTSGVVLDQTATVTFFKKGRVR